MDVYSPTYICTCTTRQALNFFFSIFFSGGEEIFKSHGFSFFFLQKLFKNREKKNFLGVFLEGLVSTSKNNNNKSCRCRVNGGNRSEHYTYILCFNEDEGILDFIYLTPLNFI